MVIEVPSSITLPRLVDSPPWAWSTSGLSTVYVTSVPVVGNSTSSALLVGITQTGQ